MSRLAACLGTFNEIFALFTAGFHKRVIYTCLLRSRSESPVNPLPSRLSPLWLCCEAETRSSPWQRQKWDKGSCAHPAQLQQLLAAASSWCSQDQEEDTGTDAAGPTPLPFPCKAQNPVIFMASFRANGTWEDVIDPKIRELSKLKYTSKILKSKFDRTAPRPLIHYKVPHLLIL